MQKMYAARFYDKYIHEHKLNIYGTELIMLPVPRLVVFYNGTGLWGVHGDGESE